MSINKVHRKVNRFVTNDFTLRIAAVDATAVVQEMQTLQNCFPLATIGIGRAMVGALLLASHLKDDQEIGLLFKGNGPLGSVYAQASFEGHVRGYCPNPKYQAPQPDDAINLKKALGFGTLNVTRHQPFQSQPFLGTVEMPYGEVGEDIAHYLHQSHQIRSLISLGVYLDSYGKVKSAGGLLIEVMPGVEEEVVSIIENNAKSQKSQVSKLILEGVSEKELIVPYLKGIPFTQIPHDYEVKYHCPCTESRVRRALSVLSLADLEDMIQKNEVTDITCQMCGRDYKVTVQELSDLKEELRKNSMH